MNSASKIIRLGEKLSTKYAQHVSLQDEVYVKDAIELLQPIANSSIKFGADKASKLLNYLNHKLLGNKVGKFVDASYIDNIIGNLVYNKVSDASIVNQINIILDAIKEQQLEESGSFTRAFIAPTIERYKKALSLLNGDGQAASEWSLNQPSETKKFEAEKRQEELKRQQFLSNRK